MFRGLFHSGQLARSLALLFATALPFSAGAAPLIEYPTLPEPGAQYDGVDVSRQLDDFVGYCACLMDQLQNAGYMPSSYGAFDFATGSGNLDVQIFTGAKGQVPNQNVGPGGAFDFENAVRNTGGSTTVAQGTWGEGDQPHGPVTVGNMLAYLQAFDPANTVPVFYADLNQAGGQPLDIVMDAYIYDPSTGTRVASWSLDGVNNGVFDPDAPVVVPPANQVTGTSGNTYDVNLTGSGKADFIFYAPGMDLSLFDPNDWLVLYGHIGDWTGSGHVLNDGFEEFFLTGGVAISDFDVPEPGILWLILAGTLSLPPLHSRVGVHS